MRPSRKVSRTFRSAACLVVSAAFIAAFPLALRPAQASNSAQEWNPEIGPPAGAKYVGDHVCAQCHFSESKTFNFSPMRMAGKWAPDAAVLKSHPRLSLRLGPYLYRIVRTKSSVTYSIAKGRQILSVPILWAFGMGIAGQSYIYRLQGAYFQAWVSFYNSTGNLDVTMGEPPSAPQNLEYAFGNILSHGAFMRCLECHTTGSVIGGKFDPMNAVPGVHCEACHGPGGEHVADVMAGHIEQAKAAIFNPGNLSAAGIDRFCGACHRTGMSVLSKGVTGVYDVRFQPYRLGLSLCWSASDKRISCLGCHNPHQPLVKSAVFYNSKCLACHQMKGAPPSPAHPAPACPVSTGHCISCHMPKYNIPQGHYAFTDHDIRIVRPGAPYPG